MQYRSNHLMELFIHQAAFYTCVTLLAALHHLYRTNMLDRTLETRRGILSKLFLLSAMGVGIFVLGKRHIATLKDQRHAKETDARTDSDSAEFQAQPLRPGFPLQETAQRESAYVGAGGAYASRKKGDKFVTMFNIFDRD